MRDRAAQRLLITSAARSMAEREGWDAVTTRRLASDIEYSQPVIYKHFASMDELAEAVALEAFAELAESLGSARALAGTSAEILGRVARAFTEFAQLNAALYDVMFSRATRLSFAGDETPAPLLAAFDELRAAVAGVAGDRDVDTLSEVFWAALHGLIALTRDRRLRPGCEDERIELLIAPFAASHP